MLLFSSKTAQDRVVRWSRPPAATCAAPPARRRRHVLPGIFRSHLESPHTLLSLSRQGALQRPAKFRSFQCEDRRQRAPWVLWPRRNKLQARVVSSDKTWHEETEIQLRPCACAWFAGHAQQPPCAGVAIPRTAGLP